MRSGRLRHRVQFDELVETQNATTGLIEKTWQKKAVLWCSVEPLSGKELIAAQGNRSEITGKMLMRHNPEITHEMRAVFRGVYYNIHAVIPDHKSGLEYQNAMTSEGVNDG